MAAKDADTKRMVIAELAKLGITSVTFEHTGGGHRKAVFRIGRAQRAIVMPSTTSDHRSYLNCRSFIRRKVPEWQSTSSQTSTLR
jgi:hypothetical protein